MPRKPPPPEKRIPTQFKKGQIANPKGRPKGSKDATTYMRERMEMFCAPKQERLDALRAFFIDKHGRLPTVQEIMLDSLIYKAINKVDTPSIRLCLAIKAGDRSMFESNQAGPTEDMPTELTNADVERAMNEWFSELKDVTPRKK